MARIINFSGEPSSGKSTAAYALFSHLKQSGYNVEIISEHSKMLAYQGSHILNQDQMYVFANQQNLMFIMENQLNPNSEPLDYIITDSPLYLSYIYGSLHKQNQIDKNLPIVLPDSFFDMVLQTYSQYDNVNILMKRNHDFGLSQGRFHNENESNYIKHKIEKLLFDLGEKHTIFETQNMNNNNFNLGKTLYEHCLENQLIMKLEDLKELKEQERLIENEFKKVMCSTLKAIHYHEEQNNNPNVQGVNNQIDFQLINHIELFKHHNSNSGEVKIVNAVNDYLIDIESDFRITAQIVSDFDNQFKENFVKLTIYQKEMENDIKNNVSQTFELGNENIQEYELTVELINQISNMIEVDNKKLKIS